MWDVNWFNAQAMVEESFNCSRKYLISMLETSELKMTIPEKPSGKN